MKNKTYHDYVVLSIIIAICVICILIILFLLGAFKIPACIFITKFNFYCPACGVTRAFICMLKGNILGSILNNPIVLYCAITILGYFGFYIKIKLKKQSELFLSKYAKICFYIGMFILLANWILRNVLLHAYNIHI